MTKVKKNVTIAALQIQHCVGFNSTKIEMISSHILCSTLYVHCHIVPNHVFIASDACVGSLQLATTDDFELKPARKWPRSHFRRGRLSIAKVYGSCCFKLYSGLRRSTLIETLDANDQVYYSDYGIKSIERIQCSGK